MHYILLSFFLFSSACASTNRHPAAVAPAGSLLLEDAITQGPTATLQYLKNQTTDVTGYVQGHPRDPAALIPQELKAEKPAPPSKEKRQQQAFFKLFRSWGLARKTAKARALTSEFECSKALEAQSLGLSLELEFPDEEATIASEALHQKVLACATFPRHESLFRLAIFAIQKNNCPKAMEYLESFPPTPERGLKDRLAYIRGFCSGTTEVAERNPWGGYGIRLTDASTDKSTPAWYLSAKSGSPEWDRLLKTFMDLTERGDFASVRHLAGKMNYEKFRNLPYSFQASVLAMMSFSGADLSVFQALHRYLSDHPDMGSPAVENLLFPKRYWKEIVQNSIGANPILVKALIRQESAFNPAAKSRAKAAGLMQLIYPTARHFGVSNRQQWLQPEYNIRAGSQFLGSLIQEFGSVELALAAYNAGPAMVRQWQKRYPTDNVDLFVEMIPYSETREYVRLVNRNYRIYQSLANSPELTQSNAVVAVTSVRGPANQQDIVLRRIDRPTCEPNLDGGFPRANELCSGTW